MFIDLLFDAEMHLHRGAVRRAIIDAAVAAETFIRSIVKRSLPEGIGANVKRVIDHTGIRKVLDDLFPEALNSLSLAQPSTETVRSVRNMFETRNLLMHQGKTPQVNGAKCRQFVGAVRDLLRTKQLPATGA